MPIQEKSPPDVEPSSSGSSTKTCQEKVETFFNTMFGAWAIIVARNPCKVFWLSILFFIICASGMAQSRPFENEQLVWTPAGNPSVKNQERGQEMFPSKGGFIGVMVEAKEGIDNILTVEAYKEIK